MKAGLDNYLLHVSEEEIEKNGEGRHLGHHILKNRGITLNISDFTHLGRAYHLREGVFMDWVTLVPLPWTCIEPCG